MKMNNKGFSMVELIIVIAIMAILVGAIAPTLIKYVNKSRKSADASNAQTLATNMQSAAADQTAADGVSGSTVKVWIANGTASDWSGVKTTGAAFENEFFSIAGANGKLAKIKYTKEGATGFLISMDIDVAASATGNTVTVWAAKAKTSNTDGTDRWELYPSNSYASN